MSKVRMSVAMCTYNGGRFLDEQLQSIAAQLRKPDEVVICDDGSVDNTHSILREFANHAPFPVRIFVNENRLGPAKNFEKALSQCDGDIIVLSDQDDLWKAQKLGTFEKTFEQNADAVYVFSTADMVDQEGTPLGYSMWQAFGFPKPPQQFSGADQVKFLLKRNLIAGATLAFRSSFREIILPIAGGWMHDYWIVLIGSTLSRGVPIPEQLSMYRRHANQVVGWKSKTFRQAIMESIRAGEDVPAEKAERFREMLSRIEINRDAAHYDPRCFDQLKRKEEHLAKRASVRSALGLSRISGVLDEAFTGRYQQFSNSWYSILRDLLY